MVSPILPSDIDIFGENVLASFAPAQGPAQHEGMKEEIKGLRLAYTFLAERRSKKDSGNPPIPHAETVHG
ncbi:MAG: hypothetical protein WA973_14570 [Mesorhizobium sp.]